MALSLLVVLALSPATAGSLLRVVRKYRMYDNYPWFVTCDRALHVEETGGAWVELSRLVENESINQVVEELDCAFYGPVQEFS